MLEIDHYRQHVPKAYIGQTSIKISCWHAACCILKILLSTLSLTLVSFCASHFSHFNTKEIALQMIVNQPSSTGRLHAMYALSLMFLSITTVQPRIIKEDLNSFEACQNRCFSRPECGGVGNGLCCRWDNDDGQCISNIGKHICPGTASFSSLYPTSIACPPTTATSFVGTVHHRNLSVDTGEAESSPTPSPTKDNEKSKTDHSERHNILDWYLCEGFSITQIINTTLIINFNLTAALSIFGSSYVIQDVLRDPKKRNESTYHRIMFCLSCSDIILSFFGPFLGTWVFPKGSQLFAAAGFEALCGVAGFFMTLAIPCIPLYNCSLATFYLLKLKFTWVNRKVKAIEKWLLFLPCTVGLITAIIAAIIERFGPDKFFCT